MANGVITARRTGTADLAAEKFGIQKLELLDINKRGDANFGALSEVEKDLYVLHLFSVLRDMEGLTDLISHHSHRLPRLLAFLAATESPNRSAVIELAEFIRVKAGGTWEPNALTTTSFE